MDTETKTRGRGTVKVGVVTSDRMTKTVVVKVESLVKHRDYHRFVKRTSTFMAHDERGDCHVGDTVEIIECRPLSKSKRWRVQRIIGKAVRIEEPQTGEGANA
jgi:small subunit ribosomal protein S17